MQKKLFILLTAGFLIVSSAFAQDTATKADIQYPVEELGSCVSEASCKKYCDKPENIEDCINFAQKNGLMTQEEIAIAKKFIATDNSQKPGRCTTKDSCEEYCNDINHIDECLSFAEKNDILPPEELAEAKKVQAAIAKGIKPPACGNKKACDIYCDSPEHMEECITFASEAGFMSEQEKADSQKMLMAIKRGVKPPPCKGKDACDAYCQEPDNMETCMNFAMEAGFMSEEEKANSQKMLTAIKKGVKPPSCKGKEECDTYCNEENHFEECLNFAEAAGFMNPEEAKMARKTGGKGPGNCKGKEECEAFCNNPDNQETCFNFGRDNGLIPEEDLKRMEEGKQQFKQSLEKAPQEILDCLNSQIGGEMLEKIKSGSVMLPREIGESMRGCYEKMGPPQQGKPGEGGNIAPPAGQNGQSMQAGPGGCKNPEECQNYCQTNPQECQNFKGPQQGPGPNGQQGPAQGPEGGMGISNEQLEQMAGTQPPCNSPEECQRIGEQIQNQIIPQTPPPCQGENCNYGPPPNGTMQPGQIPQQNQQPPTGSSPIPPLPGGGTGGTTPGAQQPMPQIQPMQQNGPTDQMAPQPQMAPQITPPPPGPAPSTGSGPAPAPGGETPPPPPPPPTSLNNPNLFMGLIVSTLDPLTRPFLYGK